MPPTRSFPLQPSPIELVQYFLACARFELNALYDPEKDLELRFRSIETKVEASHTEENKRQWNIELHVSQHPAKGENFPYIFNFHVIGMVEVAPGVAEEKVADLAKINGASLLFGFVREQLRILSSAAPFGAIHLPSVSFLDLKNPEKTTNSEADS
jgi:preprotein translocase subunit SecB